MNKTLTVIGGNGFLGKRICQAAVSSGYNVISLSRSGAPPLSTTYKDHDWINQVNWKKLDVFNPESYSDQLKQTDILVHTIGILLETNYKSALNKSAVKGGASLLKELKGIVSPNPMNKSIYYSYDHMNRESANITSSGFINANIETPTKKLKFVYISLDRGFPGLPSGYIESKRQAEGQLIQKSSAHDNLSVLVLRPGFMFDEEISGDLRSNFSVGLKLLNQINTNLLGNVLAPLIRPTVSTQKVASKIIHNLHTDSDKILQLDELVI